LRVSVDASGPQATKELIMKGTITLLSVVAALSLAPLSVAGANPSTVQPQPAPTAEAAPAPDPSAQPRADASDPVSGNTRLAALVPAGMTTREACTGFKDVSECSAALHVAQNLNIAFPDVRERVVGGQTLEAAVHALKPSANASIEVHRAQQQASEDLRPVG
jgi:hypothetical protein